MWRALRAGLLVVLSSACAVKPHRDLPLRAAARSPQHVESSQPSASAAAGERAPRELPLPESHARLRCPDELLQGAAEVTTAVALRDARTERRELLPVDLLSRFTSSDPSASGPEARYLVEFVVEAFASPRNFRRLNALHSEWEPGKLQGRLVVYDLGEGKALCQTPIRVRGDASGASLSRRLRESTRATLEKNLYAAAWRSASGALQGISQSLRFPTAMGSLGLSQTGS